MFFLHTPISELTIYPRYTRPKGLAPFGNRTVFMRDDGRKIVMRDEWIILISTGMSDDVFLHYFFGRGDH